MRWHCISALVVCIPQIAVPLNLIRRKKKVVVTGLTQRVIVIGFSTESKTRLIIQPYDRSHVMRFLTTRDTPFDLKASAADRGGGGGGAAASNSKLRLAEIELEARW